MAGTTIKALSLALLLGFATQTTAQADAAFGAVTVIVGLVGALLGTVTQLLGGLLGGGLLMSPMTLIPNPLDSALSLEGDQLMYNAQAQVNGQTGPISIPIQSLATAPAAEGDADTCTLVDIFLRPGTVEAVGLDINILRPVAVNVLGEFGLGEVLCELLGPNGLLDGLDATTLGTLLSTLLSGIPSPGDAAGGLPLP